MNVILSDSTTGGGHHAMFMNQATIRIKTRPLPQFVTGLLIIMENSTE